MSDTQVLMNDFVNEPAALRDAEVSACSRVLSSGWWILGKEVAAFESEWTQWLATGHTVGCGNGLDAIEIGLRALNIGPGDEVITTAMTAFASVLAIIRAGAVPVLADIDAQTAMLHPESVVRCLSTRTRAILLVHLYGQVGPVRELIQICDTHKLTLIEDCAQAHGAKFEGRSAGSFGEFAAWSFYPTKNLGAIGDGGALTTRSEVLADAARSLRNYGQSTRYHHPVIGLNSRLDEMQAALLRVRLTYLDQWLSRRREVARRYETGIKNTAVRLLQVPADVQQHARHLFVICCAQRNALQVYLKSNDVQSLIHYPIPVHFQAPTRSLARDPDGLNNTEQHADTCLSLPCHPSLSDQHVDRVIALVNNFKA